MFNLGEILGEPLVELNDPETRLEINEISNISKIEEDSTFIKTTKKRKRENQFIIDEETQIPFEIMREGIQNTSDIIRKKVLLNPTEPKEIKDLMNISISTELQLTGELIDEYFKLLEKPLQKSLSKIEEEEIEVLRRDEQEINYNENNDFEIPIVPETPKRKSTPRKREKKKNLFEIIQEKLKDENCIEFSKLDSFKKKETKVSLFYQLLVLQSSGKIKVEQEEPFGEIIIEKV